jgi:hypothetical protein
MLLFLGFIVRIGRVDVALHSEPVHREKLRLVHAGAVHHHGLLQHARSQLGFAGVNTILIELAHVGLGEAALQGAARAGDAETTEHRGDLGL